MTTEDTTDRTYRGRYDEDSQAYIVEVIEGTPAWNDHRHEVSPALRVLQADVQHARATNDTALFGWGHTGAGPAITARAILSDAFGTDPPQGMAGEFVEEVVSQLPRTGFWLLSWRAVIRWARGWHAT